VVGPVGEPMELNEDLEEMINARIEMLEIENRKNFEIQSVQLQMSSSADSHVLRTAALITYSYSDPTPGGVHRPGVR
jgi:hypothetical protein